MRTSVAFRMAAMAQRIGLILYAIDNYSNHTNPEDGTICIQDKYMSSAIAIVELYANDNFKVLWMLKGEFKDENHKIIYKNLPSQFTTATGKAVCSKFGQGERYFHRLMNK